MEQRTRQLRWVCYHFPLFSSEPVLDIGCGNGINLKFFGTGSIGLDGNEEYIREFPERNIKVLKWTFDEDINGFLKARGEGNRFRCVCCLNVMEHVLSPHLHLLNMRRCLEDGGYLFLSIPLARVRLHEVLKLLTPKRLSKFWGGYLQDDHVNFWVPKTFDLTVKYAGFSIVKRYYGGVARNFSRLAILNSVLGEASPTYGVVCRRIKDWNYRQKSSVVKVLREDGFLQWKEFIRKEHGD